MVGERSDYVYGWELVGTLFTCLRLSVLRILARAGEHNLVYGRIEQSYIVVR